MRRPCSENLRGKWDQLLAPYGMYSVLRAAATTGSARPGTASVSTSGEQVGRVSCSVVTLRFLLGFFAARLADWEWLKQEKKKKPRKGWREWWIIVIKPQQTTADVEDLSSEPNSAIHWLWPWQNGCHTHLLRLGWVQWSCSLSIHLGNFLYTLDLTFTASSYLSILLS